MKNWLIVFLTCFSIYCSASETRFLYVRHGEVPGNNPHPDAYLYTGCQTDESLTENGRLQAKTCATRLAKLGKINALYSSDLKRAIETATPIGEKLGLTIQIRHELREIDWGRADGQLVQKMSEQYGALEDEMKHKYPDRKIRWDYLPVFEGAETYNELLNRSLQELKAIAAHHPDETVLIIGHGRVLKTLIADSMGREDKIPYPPNCGIAEFIYSEDKSLQFVKIVEE